MGKWGKTKQCIVKEDPVIYVSYKWFNKCIWLKYIIDFEKKDAYVHYIF